MNLIILIILIILIFYFIDRVFFIESFRIKTWTPYFTDKECQPGFTNYLCNNPFIYPIY